MFIKSSCQINSAVDPDSFIFLITFYNVAAIKQNVGLQRIHFSHELPDKGHPGILLNMKIGNEGNPQLKGSNKDINKRLPTFVALTDKKRPDTEKEIDCGDLKLGSYICQNKIAVIIV